MSDAEDEKLASRKRARAEEGAEEGEEEGEGEGEGEGEEQEGDEEAAPEAEEDEEQEEQAPKPKKEGAKLMSELKVPYQKKWYEMPLTALCYVGEQVFECENGKACYRLHQCKSAPTWIQKGVTHKHLTVVKVRDHAGSLLVVWYVRLKSTAEGDEEKEDHLVLRAVPRAVAQGLYEHFAKSWSDSRKERYPHFVRERPSDIAQVVPVAVHWNLIDPKTRKFDIPDVAYETTESEPRQFSAKSASGQARGVPSAPVVKRVVKPAAAAQPPAPEQGESGPSGEAKTDTVTVSYARFMQLMSDHFELQLLKKGR
jgi:hypothetical protein